MNSPVYHIDQIDWENWKPAEYASLCFITRGDQILLIHKKRGLGAGMINGPGGRLEKGETPLQSAIRETQEEVGVTPTGLEDVGTLHFQFLDGYKLHVTVFAASGCVGQLIESDEADPFWMDIACIPYNQMWQDDPFWLPFVVIRKKFRGYFVFDKEALLSHRVDLI